MRRYLYPARPQAIDDMTGFKVDHAILKRQWDGAMTVNPDRRNPQDLIRSRPEDSALANARPEPSDVFLATAIMLEDGSEPIVNADGTVMMHEGPVNGEGI
jgi:hypothetical protein